MQDFEKLGVFYLGRQYDPAKKPRLDNWFLYDSKDLVTHAVCVGMTGSGKTGLCLAMLEEAAIDGIPAIIIDPKGDLGNLLLTFPSLQGTDFLPWINEDDAKKKGLSASDYADQQADLWKKGLASWGQDGERIARLKHAADFTIYTPGSNAGIPVSILASLRAPAQDLLDDSELLHERITTTATSLLGLLGLEGDPLQSREHILLSTILDKSWRQGHSVDLASLVQYIQTPPVSKIGVVDVDTFFPAKERFAFALKLNNLLASPSFSTWLEGEPLDIGQILHTAEGKPRMAVFSISHLSDSERMFFVTLLLSQMVGWMRGQSGTTSLRALLYMDEIFGYFPPVSNPPSKRPLLTLLKQARAYGVGVVLATQNPVDLDYKGLANTGTWFIGRLQTERDKARVLEGLEGNASGAGQKLDRQQMEQTLAGLGSRIFLMNNVHEEAPIVFESRWCLSYLRGPLTRSQIKTLMAPHKTSVDVPAPAHTSTRRNKNTTVQSRMAKTEQSPVLPPGIPHFYVPLRGTSTSKPSAMYRPMLLAAAQVGFVDAKKRIDTTHELTWLVPFTDGPIPIDWDQAEATDLAMSDVESKPEASVLFSDLPAAAGKASNYEKWQKDFISWLYRTQKLDVFRSPSTELLSNPGESERDFRVRLQQLGREQRDREMDRLRKTYAPKIAALEERIRRAEQAKAREAEQAKAAYVQTAISVGATLLNAFMGRKKISATTLERATTAARGVGRSIKETQDASRAGETIEAQKIQRHELDAQFKAETESLASRMDPLTETLETISVKPTKARINVRLVALAWAPYRQDKDGGMTAAWQ